MIDTVSRVVGQPVRWSAAPRRAGDPAALFAASDRLQRDLGWRPRFADLEHHRRVMPGSGIRRIRSGYRDA